MLTAIDGQLATTSREDRGPILATTPTMATRTMPTTANAETTTTEMEGSALVSNKCIIESGDCYST